MKTIDTDKMIGYVAARLATKANLSLEDKEIIVEEILKLEEEYLREYGLIEDNIIETGYVKMDQVAEPIRSKGDITFNIDVTGAADMAKEIEKQLRELI